MLDKLIISIYHVIISHYDMINNMKSIRHTTTVYTLLVFLYWFANSLPLALLILLMQERGLTLLQISTLFGLNALTVVLLEVPTGSLADIVGRKRVTSWAAILMIAGFAVFLTAFSFPLLLAGGIIYGMSRALASGALDAWFVDTVQAFDPEVDLQRLFASSGMMILLGLALGTLFGGIIPIWFNNPILSETAILTKYSLPLVASLIVQVIRLVLIHLLVVEERPVANQSFNAVLSTIPSFISKAVQISSQSIVMRWILMAGFGGGFVMVSLENLWQPHFMTLLENSENNTISFGIIMSGNFVLGAVGNMISPILAKRFGNRLGLFISSLEVLRGLSLIVLVLQRNVYFAALFFWLIYFGMGLGSPAIGKILHMEISKEYRSTILSIQSMVAYLGVFAGSLLLGWLAQRYNIETSWLVGSIVFILLFYPYLKIDQQYRSIGKTEKDHIDVESQAI